jgi:hypothetical protein
LEKSRDGASSALQSRDSSFFTAYNPWGNKQHKQFHPRGDEASACISESKRETPSISRKPFTTTSLCLETHPSTQLPNRNKTTRSETSKHDETFHLKSIHLISIDDEYARKIAEQVELKSQRAFSVV